MTTMSSRRHFLMTAVAAGAAVGSARLLRGQTAGAGLRANNALNVACIGVGGRGISNVTGAAAVEGVNLVAFADVDAKELREAMAGLAKAAAKANRPEPKDVKHFADYRKMLDEMGKDIDAVMVSTPDHTHAPAAMMAMAMGKHVYVEKPLTYTIKEARAMATAARKYKVATQMGNQHHSSEGAHQVVEFIKSGAIGKIKEVHCWTDRPRKWWPQGVDWPKGEAKAPETLNWDLWLGPTTKKIDYHPEIAPFKWRGYWQFGTGALGDMACHIMDTANWALDLSRPETVQAELWGATEATYPAGSTVTYNFGAKGDRPACTLTWYDGAVQGTDGAPNMPGLARWTKLPGNGTVWLGEKGTAYSDYTKAPVIIDGELAGKVKQPEKTLPRGKGHYQDWVAACRGGTPAECNFDYAGPFTEMVLLGVLAQRAGGKKIEWDAEKMEVKNDSSLNQYVGREYRKGWEVEGA